VFFWKCSHCGFLERVSEWELETSEDDVVNGLKAVVCQKRGQQTLYMSKKSKED